MSKEGRQRRVKYSVVLSEKPRVREMTDIPVQVLVEKLTLEGEQQSLAHLAKEHEFDPITVPISNGLVSEYLPTLKIFRETKDLLTN